MRSAPEISLIFADDSIVFFKANQQEAERINQILVQYQQASGQLINLDKSEISFSRNTPTDRQNMIQGWMNVKAVDGQSKYLGLPTFIGRSKT